MKKKLILKKSVIFTLILSVVVIGLIISMTTKKGIIYSGIKRVLNGLGVYTEEVREDSIQSSNYSNPGSFKIDKSFEWIDHKKLKVTYDLESKIKTGDKYKDVILVLDVSGSMEGDKLAKAKEDISELIEYLLDDSNNSIALITFETTSTIVSTFTNDKATLLTQVDNLTVAGCTNYYAALSNVYDLMSSYTQTNDHDVVTVFMTDGYPNEDTPTQNVMYQALKQTYPYMNINGIEFEMGNNIIQEVDDITDNVWITNRDNLQNALFEAAVSPDVYDNFTIDNYVSNYFNVTSSDITTNKGSVTLENNKISWDLGENLRAGTKAKMEVVLTIKDENMVNQNYYPLSTKDEVTYSLNNNSNSINHTDTLVTKNIYDVKYDVNTPSGCSLSSIADSTSAAFTSVTKDQSNLYCGGYLFKGFEVRDLDNQDIQYMNDDVFVMPGHDVEMKGVWTKQSVYKSMDGTVKESATLYNVLKEQENTLTKKYTGDHHDSFDREPTHDIYHYYAKNNDTTTANTILDSNNVKFAGYCWQMLRTTDTGGVKMIYNGPIVDGKCLNDRGNGYEGFANSDVYISRYLGATAYYYGSDYTYNQTTRKFQLVNERNDINWSTNSNEILESYPYTCVKPVANQQCDFIYYIESADSRSGYQANAYALKISTGTTSSYNYSQYGMVIFNTKYNPLVDMSYMYNRRYESGSHFNKDIRFLFSGSMSETSAYSFYYSSTISYNNSTGEYELGSDKEQISWTTYKSSSLNSQKRYTCRSTSLTTCSIVYYVIDVTKVKNNMLVRAIEGGELPADPNGTMTLSKEITNNGDGTYSIGNSQGTNKLVITRMDWYNNYDTYFPSSYYNSTEKYYYCKDFSDTCPTEEIRYIPYAPKTIQSTSGGVNYIPMSIIKFGSDVKYENGEYVLQGTIYDVLNYGKSAEQVKITNAHYTCLDNTDRCQNMKYVYLYYNGDGGLYYISLSDGNKIDFYINDMLYADDVNTYDSIIKKAVDWWFKKNIKQEGTNNKDYSVYLEETIFCGDRSISSLSGWDPNGGSITDNLKFKSGNQATDLSCAKETDRFSTSINNTKARLKYSVGLITAPEARLLNHNNIRKTGQDYQALSPQFINNVANGTRIATNGAVSNNINGYYGLRPVISLAPGIEYSEGNGSQATPYIIDVE